MIKINRRRALDLYGDPERHVELRSMYPGGRPATADEVADLIVDSGKQRSGLLVTRILGELPQSCIVSA
jgi:hypothetical protein